MAIPPLPPQASEHRKLADAPNFSVCGECRYVGELPVFRRFRRNQESAPTTRQEAAEEPERLSHCFPSLEESLNC